MAARQPEKPSDFGGSPRHLPSEIKGRRQWASRVSEVRLERSETGLQQRRTAVEEYPRSAGPCGHRDADLIRRECHRPRLRKGSRSIDSPGAAGDAETTTPRCRARTESPRSPTAERRRSDADASRRAVCPPPNRWSPSPPSPFFAGSGMEDSLPARPPRKEVERLPARRKIASSSRSSLPFRSRC